MHAGWECDLSLFTPCAPCAPPATRRLSLPTTTQNTSQTAAISLAAKHGQLTHALAVYRLMLRDGVEPKSPTLNARESDWHPCRCLQGLLCWRCHCRDWGCCSAVAVAVGAI